MMYRLNRHVSPTELMLAQLQRRIELAAQPNLGTEVQDATIELAAGLIILGVICTFVLLIWWMGNPL